MTQSANLAALGSNASSTGTLGASSYASATIPNSALSGNPTFRNRIINGAMMIDQRNAGASLTVTTSTPYTLDRWAVQCSQSSKFSIQQNAGSVTPPVGFTNYLGATSLAATSVGSGDYFTIEQRIEGYNTSDLGWGTANAKAVIFSFWVYSSLTGTFGGSFTNSGNSRSYPFTYTISAANTWEQKTITVAGDTTGTWLTTTGIGICVYFSLGMGSTRNGTAGAWAAGNFLSATGATSVVGTNGATFYITGVQLEAGTAASPFENRLYGTELQLCMRYYQENLGTGGESMPITMNYGTAFTSGNYRWIAHSLAVPMRATPSIIFYPNGTSAKTDPGKVRYLTSTGSGAGNLLDPYGYAVTDKLIVLKSYNEYSAFTCYGFLAGYAASAEL